MLLHEALLQRVQFAVLRQALDREHLGAVGLDRQEGAGLHRLAVDVHGAGAAVGGLAADVAAGLLQLLAKDVDQQFPRLDQGLDRLPVQGECDVFLCHVQFPSARCSAWRIARRVISPAMWVLYSMSPRRSSAGSQIAIACCAASSIAASVDPLPTSAAAASVAFKAVGPTLVSPMRASAQASPSSLSTTAEAAVAQSPCLRLSLQ